MYQIAYPTNHFFSEPASLTVKWTVNSAVRVTFDDHQFHAEFSKKRANPSRYGYSSAGDAVNFNPMENFHGYNRHSRVTL